VGRKVWSNSLPVVLAVKGPVRVEAEWSGVFCFDDVALAGLSSAARVTAALAPSTRSALSGTSSSHGPAVSRGVSSVVADCVASPSLSRKPLLNSSPLYFKLDKLRFGLSGGGRLRACAMRLDGLGLEPLAAMVSTGLLSVALLDDEGVVFAGAV
jgi:hypothetical protein